MAFFGFAVVQDGSGPFGFTQLQNRRQKKSEDYVKDVNHRKGAHGNVFFYLVSNNCKQMIQSNSKHCNSIISHSIEHLFFETNKRSHIRSVNEKTDKDV